MSVTVRIPTVLRTYTGGQATVDADGATVADVLADLDTRFPGIAGRVLDERGVLRRFVNVYVDEDDVRFGDGLQTVVPIGSTVAVIPAVAGG
ncbi:MoaD/ThiS family protein [Nakamurella flavida]|uniref:MoaD/ThiS family protein n=1 Tax=Nakamurella flavida TaxID=363630 RepID=A0A939C303_9ACTN|nr:MoaD/ThiS family protein [Nakamurella flavida]MBM9477120.1 MoaD/ThiS family protein [Nakamurella flavida]MDP9780066.1 molybdopterin converting factor small subunit [Nakamurella flavida]